MYRSVLSFFILTLLSIGCQHFFSHEKTIINTLDNELEFPKLNLYDNNKTIEEWRDNYNLLSIVCMYEGCTSCYPKFVEWLHKMDSIGVEKNNNVLFIIIGRNVNDFIERAKEISDPSFNYGIVIDSTKYFMKINNSIPESYFENSITIDKTNKVRLIGAPFASSKMTELYRKISAE